MIPESKLRPIFGAYINLARNNMFTILKYINSSVGAEGGVDDNEAQMYLMSVLSQKLEPEQQERARRLFFLHFPFLKFLSSDKEDLFIPFDKIRKEVIACANVLSWWRNIYSHSRATERRVNPSDPQIAQNYTRHRKDELQVCRLLIQTATVSSRMIKERYSSKNENQKGMLADDSMEFITKSRFKPAKTPEGKRTMVLNERHFLYPLKSGDILPNGENPDRLSTSGMIQLICLFLEKKYISEFLSQTQFLSEFSDSAKAPLLSQRRLVLDTLSALRVRLPESRLQSNRNETQVALDILGELKKCPAELYKLLSAKDKATFSVQSSTGENVLLRRSSDRFVPLTLAFFDTTEAFNNLRFQVNAGTFRYLFKENKKCVDGQERMRVLQESLNCFGRIQEVETLRSSEDRQIWKDFKILRYDDSPRNAVDCLPYISDVYTRYVINGDNIGMRIDGDYYPDIKHRENSARYDVTCRQADCTISRFNLPAMLFYHLLRPTNTPPAEELISKYVDSYRRFFSDVAEGKVNSILETDAKSILSKKLRQSYGLDLRDIPEKLCDYLLGKPDESATRFKKHKKELIDKMIVDTERRLERILDQQETVEKDFKPGIRSDNKPGKKGFVQIKPGNLASFLAEDIVHLQENESKMTGLNYSVMQGAIATFSPNSPSGKETLLKLFKNTGLISSDGSAGSHPFLWSVMKEPTVTGTVTLYTKYLRAKKEYLGGDIPDTAPFLYSERARWKKRDQLYYRDLAKKYLDQPIAITGSIFEQPVKDILNNLGNADLKDRISEAESRGRCNMAYLIQLYQDIILDDCPQCFYGLTEGDMEHDYNYGFYSLVRKYKKEASRIQKHPDTGKTFREALGWAIQWADANPKVKANAQPKYGEKPSFDKIEFILRSAFKELTETEKLFRRLATQDTVLFMASTSLIKKILSLPEKDTSMKQYQIGRPSEKGILDMKLPKIVKTVLFDWKDSTRNDAPVKQKMVELESEGICIKDYGEIFSVMNDRRTASLVHHLDISSISVDELRRELECYDNRRVGVFKDIFQYEDKVLESIDKAPESPDFEAIQKCDTKNSPEDKFAAGIIRNSFCHNFYPTKTAASRGKNITDVVIIDSEIPMVADSLADRISDFAKKTK